MSSSPTEPTPGPKPKTGRNANGNGGRKGRDVNGITHPKNDYGVNKNSNFRGAYKEMKGHVYQLFGETTTTQQNQFARTTEELQVYVASKFKKPTDIPHLIRNLAETPITKPDPLNDESPQYKIEIWKRESDKYDKR